MMRSRFSDYESRIPNSAETILIVIAIAIVYDHRLVEDIQIVIFAGISRKPSFIPFFHRNLERCSQLFALGIERDRLRPEILRDSQWNSVIQR